MRNHLLLAISVAILALPLAACGEPDTVAAEQTFGPSPTCPRRKNPGYRRSMSPPPPAGPPAASPPPPTAWRSLPSPPGSTPPHFICPAEWRRAGSGDQRAAEA